MATITTSSFVEESSPLWAHLMLGSLTAISGAAQMLGESRATFDQGTFDELLAMVVRHADRLTESVSALAGGCGIEAFTTLAGPDK